jgi:hypothetical protein
MWILGEQALQTPRRLDQRYRNSCWYLLYWSSHTRIPQHLRDLLQAAQDQHRHFPTDVSLCSVGLHPIDSPVLFILLFERTVEGNLYFRSRCHTEYG